MPVAGQPFNPFSTQMPQQQGTPSQQQQGFAPEGNGNGPPFGALNFMGMQHNQAIPQSHQGQQSQQGQQLQQMMQQAGLQPGFQEATGINPQAFMNFAANANQAAGARNGGAGAMIDPAMLLQQYASSLGQNFAGPLGGSNSIAQGPPVMPGTPVQQPTQALQQPVQPSPQATATPSALSTPEPKAKGRPKGSTKKKKDEKAQNSQEKGPQSQVGSLYTPQHHPQTPQSPAPGGPMPGHLPQAGMPFPQAAASPAPATFPKGPGNSSIASPAKTFAQLQERARSHTRSPTVSGPSNAAGGALQASSQPNAPPGWAPSLPPPQQQQILGQALSFSKAQASRNQNGQPLQNQSPAHILMQMGYVYVKANLLPNNGLGAGISGNGGSGPGAILSIDEAKSIGVLGPQQGPLQSGKGFSGLANAVQQIQSQQGDILPNQTSSQMPPNRQRTMSQAGQPMQNGPFGHVPQAPMAQAGVSLHGHALQNGLQASQQSPMSGSAQQPYTAPGFRASPRMGGEALPPGSSSSMTMGSPAIKPKGVRARQASASSRPASSAGRDNQSNSAHDTVAASTSATVAPSSGLPQAHAGRRPSTAAQRTSSAMAPSTQPGPTGAYGGPTIPFGSLPPVHGGPMPSKTKQGYDISPEYNTRFTPLPSSDTLTPDGSHYVLSDIWKPMTKEEEIELLEVMRKDSEYTKVMSAQSGRNNGEVFRLARQMQPIGRLNWWERGADEEQMTFGKDGAFESFKILLPADKRNQRAAQGLRSALYNGMTPRKMQSERKAAAKYDESLIPIRLEIDHEGWKLRDTFTWPALETYKTEIVDRFATSLCEDIGLPVLHFVQAIRETILGQVADHTAAEAVRPLTSKRKRDEVRRRGLLSRDDAHWWRRWRRNVEMMELDAERIRRLSVEGASDLPQSTTQEQEALADGLDSVIQRAPHPEAELRIQIRLDITVGAMNLIDQFEWDVSDEGSSAEQFATAFAADLGLSGEFKTAIAHSIREQTDVYTRSLVLVGHPFDGSEVYDEELRSGLLGPVFSIARGEAEVDAHTPKLMQLSELEIMQLEKEREREARRKRRQTRGRRGVNLPDREPQKTTRTPAVQGLQQGGQGTDGYAGAGSDGFGSAAGREQLSSTRGAAGMSTRRAAAMVATASIAHTAANEFGTPTPAPEGPSPALNARITDKEHVKRRRMESYATHFEYPGGLGKVDDEADEERDRGPKFSLLRDESPTRGPEPRAAELGGMPATAKQARQVLQNSGVAASSPSTPVAWNMARPEEALNQVPNWHDGRWHCSNCGVPGNMDLTRRKGPLGDKTLCGICGKYFHRHRKARPVDYTRDVHHHVRQLQARGISINLADLEDNMTSQSRSTDDSSAVSAAPSSAPLVGHVDTVTAKPAAPADTSLSTPEVPTTTISAINDASMTATSPAAVAMQVDDAPLASADVNDAAPKASHVEEDGISAPVTEVAQPQAAPAPAESSTIEEEKSLNSFPTTRANSPELPFEQVGSPDDSDSSGDPGPPSPSETGPEQLASGRHPSAPLRSVSPQKPSTTPQPSSSNAAGSAVGAHSGTPPAALSATSTQVTARAAVPEWLSQAFQSLCALYPLDRFEVLPRPRQEWRLRCNDCPGKVRWLQCLTGNGILLRSDSANASFLSPL